MAKHWPAAQYHSSPQNPQPDRTASHPLLASRPYIGPTTAQSPSSSGGSHQSLFPRSHPSYMYGPDQHPSLMSCYLCMGSQTVTLPSPATMEQAFGVVTRLTLYKLLEPIHAVLNRNSNCIHTRCRCLACRRCWSVTIGTAIQLTHGCQQCMQCCIGQALELAYIPGVGNCLSAVLEGQDWNSHAAHTWLRAMHAVLCRTGSSNLGTTRCGSVAGGWCWSDRIGTAMQLTHGCQEDMQCCVGQEFELAYIPGKGSSLVGGAGGTGLEQPCSSHMVASNACIAV